MQYFGFDRPSFALRTLGFGANFDPLDLFKDGKQGVWYDPSDKSTLFQDVAGTVPVTKDGDPVALMRDKSGNSNHAKQTVSTARPIYKTDGILHWLQADGVDDYFNAPRLLFSNFSMFTALKSTNLSLENRYFTQGISSQDINRTMLYSTRKSSNAKQITVLGTKTFIDTPTQDTNAHIYETTVTGTALVTQFDSQAASTIAVTFTPNDEKATIMGNSQVGFNGIFYGFVVVNSDLSASSKELLRNYLAAKSGVTL